MFRQRLADLGLCKAVGLIGARVVISRPDVVSELVAAGVELSAITAVRSLKDAIARRGAGR